VPILSKGTSTFRHAHSHCTFNCSILDLSVLSAFCLSPTYGRLTGFLTLQVFPKSHYSTMPSYLQIVWCVKYYLPGFETSIVLTCRVANLVVGNLISYQAHVDSLVFHTQSHAHFRAMLPYCPLRCRAFFITLARFPPFPPIIPVFSLFPGYYPLNNISDAALIREITEHRDRG
jgi:hypothetical protein